MVAVSHCSGKPDGAAAGITIAPANQHRRRAGTPK